MTGPGLWCWQGGKGHPGDGLCVQAHSTSGSDVRIP